MKECTLCAKPICHPHIPAIVLQLSPDTLLNLPPPPPAPHSTACPPLLLLLFAICLGSFTTIASHQKCNSTTRCTTASL